MHALQAVPVLYTYGSTNGSMCHYMTTSTSSSASSDTATGTHAIVMRLTPSGTLQYTTVHYSTLQYQP
eukprot:1939-Heterococcus_DN1.PRE.2